MRTVGDIFQPSVIQIQLDLTLSSTLPKSRDTLCRPREIEISNIVSISGLNAAPDSTDEKPHET